MAADRKREGLLSGCIACGNPTPPSLRYRLKHFHVRRCYRCGLQMRDPLPTDDEVAAMYDDEAYHDSALFENAVERFDERSPEVRIWRRALDDLAVLTSGRLMLDVGAGAGLFAYLAGRAGWTVQGIELSGQLCARARERLGITLRQGSFPEASPPDERFDVITMWDLLEHVPAPLEVLTAARRRLRPGGLLLVFTINSESLFNRAGDLAAKLSGLRWMQPLELLYDRRHCYYFTPASLRALLSRAGFSKPVHERGDRAHLGRWLSESASPGVVAAGNAIDLAGALVGNWYRQTLCCRVDPTAETSSSR